MAAPPVAGPRHMWNMSGMTDMIINRFRHLADNRPDAPFLIHPDGASLSYGEAWRRCARMANLFRSLGICPGDRIALQAEKSEASLLAYLAAMQVGAVFLPLNTAYTLNEVDYFLGDAAPALLICRESDDAAMATLCSRHGIAHRLTLDAGGQGTLVLHSADQDGEMEPAHRQADDLAAILYTSGTTGRSKGAMLTQDNLASNAEALAECWRFTAHDRLLHALPIYHTHGLFVATNVCLWAGAAMIFVPQFHLDTLLRLMPDATTMMGVPTFYSRLLADPRFDEQLAGSVRLFISGSAPLSPETHRAFARRTGKLILERYGMTETSIITTNPHDGERKPGSVGLPLPGVSLRIADPETGRVLSHGEVGVIEVRGPNVFPGYWQMPEKTAEEFRADGWFITGDLGHVDTDGYVHISGRAKDLIISGGLNIYPAEVEALIDAVPGVAESAVIGVPHADLGEAAVAVIRVSDSALQEDAVLAALAPLLARFKQPRRVCIIDELPRNSMGKVQKKALRERYAKLFAG